ncbi:hypothetical protein NDU88_005126 [Pleurodeles waltl]|uniref:Uncharacterized protein n=1 Tax=Pleurodeles waltl TaxID=8319 RepID=A0AAV7VIZ0_PLEWA|nr:hypothetical protein NDU88_005126 [Pleurodeles waltl]
MSSVSTPALAHKWLHFPYSQAVRRVPQQQRPRSVAGQGAASWCRDDPFAIFHFPFNKCSWGLATTGATLVRGPWAAAFLCG